MTIQGWGAGPWGSTPWGAGFAGGLALVSAQAVRENVVRFGFNIAPRFTGTLEPGDGSTPEHYQVIALTETTDDDGQPARPVSVVTAAVAAVAGAEGRLIDVTIDRPMSAFPTRYRAVVNGLVTLAGAFLVPGSTSVIFDAVHKGIPRPLPDQALSARDIANPQTHAAFFDPLPEVKELLLGTIPVDEQGDYAFDQGITSYRKRIFRRLLTRKGKFSHLPGYGVGTSDQVKKLARVGITEALCADAEAQIREEPETEDVSVRMVRDRANPSLWRMQVRARTVTGDTVNLNVPFNPTEP